MFAVENSDELTEESTTQLCFFLRSILVCVFSVPTAQLGGAQLQFYSPLPACLPSG